MIQKSLDDVTAADLQALIEDQVAEGKAIEYKRELSPNADGGSTKILRAISSFANSSDGDLLYGVEAVEGVPIALPGLDSANEDEIRLRLENLCRDGLQPRVPSIQFKFIPVAAGRSVLIVRVRKSWNPPHRVIVGGHGHFYGRNSAGAYQLDVEELRSTFALSETAAEQIRQFRVKRVEALIGGTSPVRMLSGAKLLVHLLPVESFVSSQPLIDIRTESERLAHLRPIGAAMGESRVNLEGFVIYTVSAEGQSRTYTQVFRSGVIESVAVFTADNPRYIYGRYEQLVLESVSRYLQEYRRLNISPPVYVGLALVDARGFSMMPGPREYFDPSEPLDRDVLILPEFLVENFERPLHTVLRPGFDMMCNAFGFQGSYNYDAEGDFVIPQ